MMVDVGGTHVEVGVEPGDLVLDAIIIARVVPAGEDGHGFVFGASDKLDPTIVLGMLDRAHHQAIFDYATNDHDEEEE